MRLFFRFKRMDKAGKHNDRNFDVTHSNHIIPEMASKNEFWTYNGNNLDTFDIVEKDFYNVHFYEYLDSQNHKKITYGNKNRTITMDEYYKGVHGPEDILIYVGSIQDHIDADTLWACALEYAEQYNRKYKSNSLILTLALHRDEATPHVHGRVVWIAHDNEGREYSCQSKALEELSIVAPDCDEPSSKNNNAKMSFTYDQRQKFINILKEHDIDIEEPRSKQEKRIAPQNFKSKKLWESIMTIEEDTDVKISAIPEVFAALKNDCKMISSIIKNLELCPLFTEQEHAEGRKKKRTVEILEYYLEILNSYLKEIYLEEDIDQVLRQSMMDNLAIDYIHHIGEDDGFQIYSKEKQHILEKTRKEASRKSKNTEISKDDMDL